MTTKTTSFTIDQIKTAHAKVKSGADFPKYIQEIKQFGVASYETYVIDGHTDYFDEVNHQAGTTAKYEQLPIGDKSDAEAFKVDLKAHQQGKTDYLGFCNDCAKSGIEKWAVDMDKMTCTYYDKAENVILVEKIPG